MQHYAATATIYTNFDKCDAVTKIQATQSVETHLVEFKALLAIFEIHAVESVAFVVRFIACKQKSPVSLAL